LLSLIINKNKINVGAATVVGCHGARLEDGSDGPA